MKYLFYMDLGTVTCDSETVEKILKENSKSFLRISDNLWTLDIPKYYLRLSPIPVPNQYFDTLFDEFLNDNSISFMQAIDSNYQAAFVLPDTASNLLFDNAE